MRRRRDADEETLRTLRDFAYIKLLRTGRPHESRGGLIDWRAILTPPEQDEARASVRRRGPG